MSGETSASTAGWLVRIDMALLRGAVSRRTLALALASDFRYEEPLARTHDARTDDSTVVARLTSKGARTGGWPFAETYVVTLRPNGDLALLGACSRCAQAFGPCVHLAVVAVDLACSMELRDSLVRGERNAEACARAPAVRAAVHLEHNFEGALGAWLVATPGEVRLEIAATPFDPGGRGLGRPYGARNDPADAPALTVFARRLGERKLMAPREVAAPNSFGARDRRALRYAVDMGHGRKATYAVGVDASLTLEAMRAHGGIFAEGYRTLLDFRGEAVIPAVTLRPAEGDVGLDRFDTLSARWTTADGKVSLPFADSVFFPGPFPYVWARSGAIHPVRADVDLDFAQKLARAPILHVPPERLKDTGERLLRAARGRGIAMPAHEAFGLPPLETPRIVLRLSGEPLDFTGQLVAVYREREVSLETSPHELEVGGRDLECEGRARAWVEKAGLLEASSIDEDAELTLISASGERAVSFWQHGVVALRHADDPSIVIELSERLAGVRIGAPITGRVHVTLEGNWLDTRLEFASKELGVELEAIRRALARKRRWVALGDGTLAEISTSVEALANQAATVMGIAEQALLPAHQLGRIDRWIEENDGRIDAAVDALRRRLRALAVAENPDMPVGLVGTLRPYQRLGLSWLQFLQALGAGGILADDMGLGKTITTLAFLLRRKESEGPAPTLVVCPTSVVANWLHEAQRFTPDLAVLPFLGSARDLEQAKTSDILVTTYAVLRRDEAALAGVRFRCVVLDEAQNIKNPDSATARAANRLDTPMRLALSGTPMENRLRELWSLASFANPGILGSSRAFETRFEKPISTDRESPLAAELRAVVRPFLLRRTKDDVLDDLPQKTEVDRVVVLKPADKRMYDALAHTLRASVARDIEKRGHTGLSLSVFTALTRLRQMACDPRLIDASVPAERSAKREAFLELVRELVAEGRRALVFSQFVQLLTLWRRDLDAEGIAYEYLDGASTRRGEIVARFQEGAAPLFLISLKAGGAGLNLTAADTVIHCDPWWNPAVEDQATDRAHRIGQDKPVTVVRLVASGTIEEKILSLKAKKRELTKVVIGDEAHALSGITEEDIRLLLGDAETTADEGAEEEMAPAPEAAPAPRKALTDPVATGKRVLRKEFLSVAAQAQRWLALTGRPESELASIVDIPVPYVSRLVRGEPFPCSRAVADRIRTRLRDW